MKVRRLPSLLLIAVLATACTDEQTDQRDAEVDEMRNLAQRRACISTELLAKARSDYETLRSTVGGDEANPVLAQAMQASVAFSAAYLQHAELRQSVYANMDSAYNLASSPSDSVRYVQRADAIVISAPESGTVEANVMADYDRDFNVLASDADFPCNWE